MSAAPHGGNGRLTALDPARRIGTVADVTAVDPSDGPASTVPATNGRAARAMLRLLDVVPGRRDDAVAIVNGLFGDTLEQRGSDLATAMTVRVGDKVLPLDRGHLADTLAESGAHVSRRICVLVHGLMSTEAIWRLPDVAETSTTTTSTTTTSATTTSTTKTFTTYGTLLAAEHDVTVLALRYNTGRHIAANGRELAHLLDQLVAAWPVRVREIDLIGHSMGGLVVRSACHYGSTLPRLGRWWPLRRRWTSKVRRVVLIGVPNTGAGLAALVSSVSAALSSFPVAATRTIGRGLERRSAGIKDLRRGTIRDDEGPDTFDARSPHRRLRRAAYLVIAGSVTTDPDHRIAKVFGDALVTPSSAAGLTADIELFPGATVRTFPKVTHNALAHHSDVYRAIADWW